MTGDQLQTIRRLVEETTADIDRLRLRRQELIALLPEEPREKRNQQPVNPRELRK